MKKLLLLLLLSLSFVGSVNAHSGRTDSNGGHNDYSNGTYHYHNTGNNNTYGAKNNPCGIVGYNENTPGYTPCPGILASEASYNLGTAIVGIIEAVGNEIANEKSSKTKYNPKTGQYDLPISKNISINQSSLTLPENAVASGGDNNYWYCKVGYKKVGNQIKKHRSAHFNTGRSSVVEDFEGEYNLLE